MVLLYFALLLISCILAIAMLRMPGRLEARILWNGAVFDLTVKMIQPLGQKTFHVTARGPEWMKDSSVAITASQYSGRIQTSKSPLSDLLQGKSITAGLAGTIDLEKIRTGRDISNLLLHFLIINQIEWKTVIGAGDAMKTALASGSMWALKGILISKISFQGCIQDINILIQPVFSRETFESTINCIFKMRIVHIIFIKTFKFLRSVRSKF